MKIIKDSTIRKYTCFKCKSILEVGTEDIYHIEHKYNGHIIAKSYYYICPCCGERNIIKVEEFSS